MLLTTYSPTAPAKRIMSLKEPHLKMSKSHADPRSRILLTDSADDIHRKIKVALTDSEPLITYDPARRPGVSNLIEILGYTEAESETEREREGSSNSSSGGGGQARTRTFEEIAAEHENEGLRVFKEYVADKVAAHLEPIRERYFQLVGDDDDGKRDKYLDDVARMGAEKARANADKTMNKVREAVGL